MPGGKKQDAITLTFSKKNKDLYKFLQERKTQDQCFVINEYVCDAIRFYRENKGFTRHVDEAAIEKIVDKRLEALLAEFKLQPTPNPGQSADLELNTIKSDSLESDIDDIDIEGE